MRALENRHTGIPASAYYPRKTKVSTPEVLSELPVKCFEIRRKQMGNLIYEIVRTFIDGLSDNTEQVEIVTSDKLI
mgnify:FL=1